jgi:hypothetical protein
VKTGATRGCPPPHDSAKVCSLLDVIYRKQKGKKIEDANIGI